ncbi:MAG: hypothetical protein ACOY6N_13395 [Pseudomonadota bacterium]|uniref:hypothetical protein n=1 Tax=Sulfuricystis thermophila TaxID=2496847 RepID=UPI001036814E|nr:hypothetical protein [Sulfuricystis thermophila]MDI6749760.1 hypothetical protein [Rhodocyclaceae bacterium]
MEAIRQIVQVEDSKVTVVLPTTFPSRRVEVIVLPVEANMNLSANSPAHAALRRPSPAIAGKGRILGDILGPAVPAEDWESTHETTR